MEKNVFFMAVVERGKANEFAKEAQEIGIGKAMILMGEGSVRSDLLKMLEMDRAHKEVVIYSMDGEQEKSMYEMLERHGNKSESERTVAFSIPMRNFEFNKLLKDGDNEKSLDELGFENHCIVVIVDRGLSTDCINSAIKAGAAGGTIIHGHGAGVPQEFYFPLLIEPQKEIVISVVAHSDLENVRSTIVKDLELDKPAKGILFTMPVTKTFGFHEIQNDVKEKGA